MYDVIVIGAGPTGATAAKILAENKLSVLVVERMKLPRYKSCSGMLIKKTIDLVKKYNDEKIFSRSKKLSVTFLNKPVITLNNTKKKTIVVSWKKIPGATGYTVYRSTSLNGTYTALKSVTTTSYSNINLTTGKKYYYKVKAYKTVDGAKVYSNFSNALGKEVK